MLGKTLLIGILELVHLKFMENSKGNLENKIFYNFFSLVNMINSVFAVAALSHVYLLFLSFQVTSFQGKFFLCIQELGLILDNVALFLGVFLQPSPFLKLMSQIRFLLHMVIAPTLFFVIGDLYSSFFDFDFFSTMFVVLSTYFSIEGFIGFLNIKFVVRNEHNLISYTREPKAEFREILPLILMNVTTLVLGGFIWIKKGDYILFLTSLIMFITAAIPRKYSFHLSNVGEIFFTYGLIYECLH
jgi:hypothetical protein